VRKAKLSALKSITGRPIVVYATDWIGVGKLPPQLSHLLSIDYADKDSFADITQNISGDVLDLYIHSPGGLAEKSQRKV
jgi:hypothetical protein